MWRNFVDKIYVVNLLKRTDRLLQITEDFEKYEIPFERFQAIENDRGAEGLRDTMKLLFESCVEKGYRNVLVFEDDADFVIEKFWFHDTMDKVAIQLPDNYHICFLGCQLTVTPSHFHSPNLISAQKMFSTHAAIYSLQGMKEILSRDFDFPIDNYYVAEIQPMGHCYCTYPLLCSQREGYSDIGHNFISWKPFIEHRFEQKVSEITRRW